MIGVFHDAIPLRIHEGQHWNPAAFYNAAGLMANRATAIACDSQSSERDLHAFFPSARHKTQVVYLGHDRQRFLTSAEQPGNSGGAAKMSRPAGKRIAMIGEIEPRKNQAGVLRACRYLRAERPEERITLVLIGDKAPQNPYAFLERMAQQHVNIEHLGYVSDSTIGDALRSCDAFLYPSLWEGFGIPVLEAMSAGVPVVCSDGSSLPEVGGPLAFYCDPHDPCSIAAAVRRALAMSSDRRKEWVREVREHASRFTWSASARQLLALVEDASAVPGQRRFAFPVGRASRYGSRERLPPAPLNVRKPFIEEKQENLTALPNEYNIRLSKERHEEKNGHSQQRPARSFGALFRDVHFAWPKLHVGRDCIRCWRRTWIAAPICCLCGLKPTHFLYRHWMAQPPAEPPDLTRHSALIHTVRTRMFRGWTRRGRDGAAIPGRPTREACPRPNA